MRTIKFRGKCCHCDAWAYGNLVDYGEDECPEIQGFDVYHEGNDIWQERSVERDTIGQFTGLYDKNGKEIYEGDIIKIPTKHGDDVFWIGYESSHIGAFCLCEDDDCNSRFVSIFGRNYDYEPFDCEVIGNIHDNLKLLENGTN